MSKYREMPDMGLVALLKQGNNYAFKQIYNRYFGILFAFTGRKLQDQEEAKDMVQDLFLNIWDKREFLNLTDNFSAYLYRSVRNKMINNVVKRDAGKKYLDSLYGFIDQDQIMSDHLIREKQLATLIKQEIKSLPVKMREVFLLSRKANMNHEQIAKELNLSKKTVRSHVQHALKILRRNIKP